MKNELPLPREVSEAYPSLAENNIEYVGRFTPDIPVAPDRIYDLYRSANTDEMMTHVTADYPDPVHDGKELRDISGYSFIDIVAPGTEDKYIDIADNDSMNEEFFVKIGNTYHYVANVRKAQD